MLVDETLFTEQAKKSRIDIQAIVERKCRDDQLVFLPATCSNIIEMTQQIAWLNQIQPVENYQVSRSYYMLKRIIDLGITLAALPFLAVLFVLVAILIKLEDPKGPVIFRQDRTGKDGNRFQMFKFRTMVYNAEELKKELAYLNELEWPDFKISNDPRITRMGKLLRKTSLDELPQFINILLGQMSLVGPRPTSFKAETYELWQTERLDVTPGLTGLWQILGRSDLDFCERSCLDIIYIERRSVKLDLLILFHTFTAVLKQRGAY
jgi:lipopolysaccharide/colanic/teichoic acid biosynthesis glycosyltransferase